MNGLKAGEIADVLTQALRDPRSDVFVLINELDKIPGQEAFEALPINAARAPA